jgi:hypothetical protein
MLVQFQPGSPLVTRHMSSEEKSSGVPYVELAQMRGEIVSGLANIESGMCKCISAYFIDSKLENPKWMEFCFEILYHDFLNFSVKKDAFKIICQRKKVKDFPFEELMQLQKIRNKFAHSWALDFGNDNQDLFLLNEFDGKDAKTLYEDYKKLFKLVNAALLAIIKKEEWFGKNI